MLSIRIVILIVTSEFIKGKSMFGAFEKMITTRQYLPGLMHASSIAFYMLAYIHFNDPSILTLFKGFGLAVVIHVLSVLAFILLEVYLFTGIREIMGILAHSIAFMGIAVSMNFEAFDFIPYVKGLSELAVVMLVFWGFFLQNDELFESSVAKSSLMKP